MLIARLVTEATACVQQLRDLLECVWPGVLDAERLRVALGLE